MIHLYYTTSISKQIQEITDSFDTCEHIDIAKLQTIPTVEVYLVEISKTEKTLLLHIKKLLSNKKNSLIYFFINDSHSLMLFQLASLLNVKSIVTPKHNIVKTLSMIQEDILAHKTLQIEHSISKSVVRDHSFMIFHSDELIFASQKLYDDFNCHSLNDVEYKICAQLDLHSFLEHDISVDGNFTFITEQKAYNIRSATSDFNGNVFIYIQSISSTMQQNISSTDFIKNRIYFIEILKEKVLEKSISETLLGVITIQVENMTNLRNDWNEYEIEIAIRDLLLQVEIEIESHTLLAQYDNGLYLTLFENLDFEALKQLAAKMHRNISSYLTKQKIKPIIGLYAFDINDFELNNILKTISDISKEEVAFKDVQTQKLHRILSIEEGLDDARVIDIFLQTTFINKAPLKLLNIYKGLCVNTHSLIIKKTEDEVHLTFEQLQGTAMHFEKESVMQSSNFSKDIVADVAYIDIKKKIVHLKNFRFIKGSANARKYSRVIPSQRTPISLSHKRSTFNGEVLDISMNSIALKTRLYPQMKSLKHSSTTLNFTLPVTSSADGYLKLTLTGQVIFTICDDEYCKVVVHLDEDQANESILMEYVYNRQKEIIVELKKQTTMLN